MKENSVLRQYKCSIITACVFTLLGGILFVKFDDLLKIGLQTQLHIEDGNDFTKAWTESPFPLYFNVYVFGITNPDEFVRGAKAKMKEFGPYRYKLTLFKEILSYNQDQTIVKFLDYNSFHFLPRESKGKLTDKLHVFNFPVYAMAHLVRTLVSSLPLSGAIEPIAFGLVSVLFFTHGESSIKEITAGELLNGYPFSILNTMDILTRPLSLLGIKLPDTGMPDNKFGFLWTKNFTKVGPYEAYTGQKNTPLLNLVSFKDQNSLNFYGDDQCNAINGTEGSTLGMDVKKDKKYYLFTNDLCRSIYVKFVENSWVNNIRAYRFSPDSQIFAAPRKNPFNQCYCTTLDRQDWCDGVFDLNRCLKAPLVLSFPHFIHASKTIQSNVENLKPSLKKHMAYIDVEPNMGAPLRGAEKLQMNALVNSVPYLSGFRNFRETILPLIWFEKEAVINDLYTKQFRMALYPVYVVQILIYVLLFGGLAWLIMLTALIFKKKINKKEISKTEYVKTGSPSSSIEPLYQRTEASERTEYMKNPRQFANPQNNNFFPRGYPQDSKVYDSRNNNFYNNSENLKNVRTFLPQLENRNRTLKPQQKIDQNLLNDKEIGNDNSRKDSFISILGVKVPESIYKEPLENAPTWTSVNDIVFKQEKNDEPSSSSDRKENQRDETTNQQQSVDEKKISWSPPGLID